MGFSNRWIMLVMACVSTVSYSIVVNGAQCGRIVPSRGLRQGNLLSPYLFLLYAEGLSSLLKVAEKDGAINGVATSRLGPKVSHLFFVDDSLLFFAEGDCHTRLHILQTYEKASGQSINIDKSRILFSSNTNL